ncbi:MAG: hypothetical protein ACUVTW_10105 [Thermogutta sp.]
MPSVSNQQFAGAQTSLLKMAAGSRKHHGGTSGMVGLLLVWIACVWTAAGCATVPSASPGKVNTVQGWTELERPGL